MTAPVVLAVDGGNSKTDLALVRADGTVLAYVRGPLSSPHHLGLAACCSGQQQPVAVRKRLHGDPVRRAVGGGRHFAWLTSARGHGHHRRRDCRDDVDVAVHRPACGIRRPDQRREALALAGGHLDFVERAIGAEIRKPLAVG